MVYVAVRKNPKNLKSFIHFYRFESTFCSCGRVLLGGDSGYFIG